MAKEEPADFISKKVSYMCQAIHNALPEVVMQNFNQLADDADRFTIIWHAPVAQDVFVFEPEYAAKSKEMARAHREKGNEYFQRKSYLTALREYNISVINAPTKDAATGDVSTEGTSENGVSDADVKSKDTDAEKAAATQPELGGEESKKSDSVEQKIGAADGEKKVEGPVEGETPVAEDALQKPAGDVISTKEASKPENKNELALAYANRSAALFHLKRYRECLRDIDLAIDSNYPESMRYKLFERRGACHHQLGDAAAAAESYQQALNAVPLAGLSAKATDTLTSNLAKQLEGCSKSVTRSKKDDDADVEGVKLDVPALTGDASETHPNASAAVKIRYDTGLGRHMIAAKDVKVGDVLVSEKPYAAVMLPGDYTNTHCYRCFAQTSAPVPCQQCTSVIFCSRECRDVAWKSYHWAECRFSELLAPVTCAKIGHLAARLVMSQGLSALLSYLKKVTPETTPVSPDQAGFDENGKYVSSYHSVYNLVTNAKKRSSEDLFEYTVLACVIIKIMKVSGYLDEIAESSRDLELIGGAVLRHLLITQCNAYRIIELSRPSKFDEPKPVNVGVGIYPTAALINHSCDPNADLNFYGNSVIVRAIRNIAEGEEVCISYGPIFYEVKQRARQTGLKGAYFFTCRCEACRENWPVAEEMFDDVPKYRCENCRSPLVTEEKFERKYFTCFICKHKQDMEDVVGRLQLSYDVFARAMNTAMNGASAKALPDFVQHLLLLQRYIRHPWRDLASCQTAVKHCYRLMANIHQ